MADGMVPIVKVLKVPVVINTVHDGFSAMVNNVGFLIDSIEVVIEAMKPNLAFVRSKISEHLDMHKVVVGVIVGDEVTD